MLENNTGVELEHLAVTALRSLTKIRPSLVETSFSDTLPVELPDTKQSSYLCQEASGGGEDAEKAVKDGAGSIEVTPLEVGLLIPSGQRSVSA